MQKCYRPSRPGSQASATTMTFSVSQFLSGGQTYVAHGVSAETAGRIAQRFMDRGAERVEITDDENEPVFVWQDTRGVLWG